MADTVSYFASPARRHFQIFRVIVTKRRLMIQGTVVADQLPAYFVVVAAILGPREESNNRVRAHQIEERGLLDFGEHLYLLLRRERRKLAGVRIKLLRFGLKIQQPLRIHRLTLLYESRQRTVNEV